MTHEPIGAQRRDPNGWRAEPVSTHDHPQSRAQVTETSRPLLLSVNQAAELLGIHRATIYDLIATGQLRSTTLGRRRLIPRAALESFVAALDQRAERAAAEKRALAARGARLDRPVRQV